MTSAASAGRWRTLRTDRRVTLFIRPRRPRTGLFIWPGPQVRPPPTEDNVPNSLADTKPARPPPGSAPLTPGLVIRAREPNDWQEIAALTELQKVRWGTLRLPYTSKDQWRKMRETPPEERTGIVALLEGRIMGTADIFQYKGRRRHVGELGMS